MLQLIENNAKRIGYRSVRRGFHSSVRIRDGSFLQHAQQPPAHDLEIRQRTRDKQSIRVLVRTPIARVRKPEHPLDSQEQMLDRGPCARFSLALRPLYFVHDALASTAAVRHVQSTWRACSDDIALPWIGQLPHTQVSSPCSR